MPDGRPIAVTVVFTDEQIALTGVVPSEAAVERVLGLVLDYRLSPASVVNNLTIDSDVPADAGVRVVEYNAVHFVDDTDTISPEHAQQLDRIVGLMSEFPAAMVHVVGNTDLRGD